MTWFEQLFGFEEGPYEETMSRFQLSETRLTSLVNGRSFSVGTFSRPSLADLRARVRGKRRGRLRLRHEVIGDVLELHALPGNGGAMFQVASQLNCLEFAGPDERPEDGVTQYDDDPTQGPACSLAAAAATVYRNYFVPVEGRRGQRQDRQLNNLRELQAALGGAGEGVRVRHGYTFSDAESLDRLNGELLHHDRESLMGDLRIGLQQDVDVTFATRFVEPVAPTQVSQAFCSALSCGYTGGGRQAWAPLASLVLDAAYEATLCAAVVDAAEGRGSGRVWLTLLGGGAFGNDVGWIGAAIRRATDRMRHYDLDVRVAHHLRTDDEVLRHCPASPS